MLDNRPDLLKRPIPIHITIVTLFLCVVIPATGVLIWYNYQESVRTAISSANIRLTDVNDNIVLKTRQLLSGLSNMTDTASELPDVASPPTLTTHPATPFILRMLHEQPQVYSAYMGFANGEFIQIFAIPPDAEAKRRALHAPDGTAFAVRRILLRPDRQCAEIWQFLDGNWRVRGSTAQPETSYDPRVRPWYKAAIAGDGTIRSDLYIFQSTKDIGLTMARRFDGAVPGVFAADLTLRTLAGFLKEQGKRIGGTVIMFGDDGRLWAHPDEGVIEHRSRQPDAHSPVVSTPRIEDLGDPVLSAMYRLFRESGGRLAGRMSFEAGGRTYLARVASLSDVLGEGQYVAAISPLSAFTAAFDSIRTTGLVLSVLFVLLALPAVYLISRKVSRPLRALMTEADTIRRFELGEPLDVDSRITEVMHLSRAMAGMKTALATFGKFAPSSLVKQLIRTGTPVELGGVKREITLMFSDVANFTDLTESMPPENVMKKISSYMERMTGFILGEGGTIDKFIGDGIMAFWNAPERHRDHAAKACRSVLLCRHASESLNADWASWGWEVMRTRFGLHTGEAVVGTMGSSDRMEYTAIGAVVNLASRLEGLNKFYGTQILVSEKVFALAGDGFVFRPVDVVAPKGNTLPTRIYELIAARPGPDVPPQIVATDAQVARAEAWAAAFTVYEARDWARAEATFRELAEADPEDRPAAILAERCAEFVRQPPPDDWDGVERHQSK